MSRPAFEDVVLEPAYDAGKEDGIRNIPESRAITNSQKHEDSEAYLEGYYDFLAR